MYEKRAAAQLIDQLETLLRRISHDGVVFAVIDYVHDGSSHYGLAINLRDLLTRSTAKPTCSVSEEDRSSFVYFKIRTATNWRRLPV